MMALKERRMKVNMNDFEEAKKKTLFRKKSKEPEGLYLWSVWFQKHGIHNNHCLPRGVSFCLPLSSSSSARAPSSLRPLSSPPFGTARSPQEPRWSLPLHSEYSRERRFPSDANPNPVFPKS